MLVDPPRCNRQSKLRGADVGSIDPAFFRARNKLVVCGRIVSARVAHAFALNFLFINASPGVEISFRLTVGVALSGHSQACKLQDPQVALRCGPSQVPKSNTSGHHGQSLIGVDAEMNLAGIQSPVGATALCEDLFQKLPPNGPMAAFDKERLLVFLAHWNIVIYHEGGPLSFAGVVHANLIPSIWRDAFALEQLLVRVEIFHEKVTSFTSFP